MIQKQSKDSDSCAGEAWRIFRIMGEMVNAIDTLNSIEKNCISIFGASRSLPDSQTYKDAEKIAHLLVTNGYGVISGGGPGTMEAVNKGAYEAGGPSIGLHIHLPYEQDCNKYLTTRCNFNYFFIRKFMFIKYSMAYVIMPGGIGTLDELSEALVMVQTGRIKPFPIVLYDSQFWAGLIDWLYNTMTKNNYVSSEELKRLITVCDTPEDVVDYIKKIVII